MTRQKKGKPDQGGFTLIELIIVVAVVAVLASIAVPMYRDFVVRSNRSDAIISLTELANLQEKHYSNEMAYTTSFSALSYSTTSPEGFYELNIATSATVDYTLIAEPLGQQFQDDETCRQFTLNSFGQRSAQDSGGNDTSQQCWNR
ncbi:MAG: type IV pilin protein [Gammaproteobacteria bacterium]|nr:type IV pilin protein [Gammaproteobacteria bacterium]